MDSIQSLKLVTRRSPQLVMRPAVLSEGFLGSLPQAYEVAHCLCGSGEFASSDKSKTTSYTGILCAQRED